jgi:hypothetical protein
LARKNYSCDFETTTQINDCRVWAYGWMEIGNKINYKIGNSLEEFMKWCEEVKGILYFHNLKFDGSFIVNYLLKQGYKWNKSGAPKTFNAIISNMGQWYMIDICYGYKIGKTGKKTKLHTVIYDSLKKLPFSVKKIAKDFQLEVMKGDIDYHSYRPVGHEITPEEYVYIKNDIEIIADALRIQFEQGLDRMTTGSDSLAGFKAVISKKIFEKLFPVLTLEADEEIRPAYKGGFTWVNERFQGKEIGAGMVFDVNSLYPSVMYDRSLPYGLPVAFNGKYDENDEYPLYIQHLKCEFEIKEGYIPTIQIKKNPRRFKENEYLKYSDGELVELYVTNIDWDLIQEHYHVYNIEYIDGCMFRGRTGIFKQFIDKWMYVKTHETGSKKALAKLMLNSLYGKFASNPNVTGKVPYLKEDGSNGFRLGDEEFKDPVYTPMGAFITAWARWITITTAQKCYDRIIYCDTDSIHLVGTETPEAIEDIIDPDKLGYWKHEGNFTRAKFIRQKTYVEEVNGHLDVKCAGMPERVKENVTFENFEIGFTSFGKLLPKQVDGGVVLIDTEFTLR